MTASVTCRFIVWFVFREALAGDKGASCDPAGLGWLQRQAPLQIQLHLQWTGWERAIKSIQKCSHKPFCSLFPWSGTFTSQQLMNLLYFYGAFLFFPPCLGMCHRPLHGSPEDRLHLWVFWLQGAEQHGPQITGDPLWLRGGEQPHFLSHIQQRWLHAVPLHCRVVAQR